MSRIARVIATEYPHHIVHRGNNKQRIFLQSNDYCEYLSLLKHYQKEKNSPILAYCLMRNHVHLLLKPLAEDSLPKMMQGVALCYAQYINKKYGRTGRLWEARYFSSIVDRDDYLWTVVRYIEQNPLRAGIVEREIDYPYSSARAHLLKERDDILTEALFNESERSEYVRFAAESATKEELARLRDATKKGKPFGSEPFITEMEHLLKRNFKVAPRGRPVNIDEI